MTSPLLRASSIVLLLAGCGDAKKPPVPPVQPPPPPPDERRLHVPSPDWAEQVIYFVLTDRFANGDPTNDDQGRGELDAADPTRYSGGDLRGVTGKLDYIAGLGATAVWITPPVANQWWDPRAQFSGYHGYWARNLKAVDEHQGTLEDYRGLSHALHTRGMYLIQDIVPNHMGNFFTYEGAWNPADPTQGYVVNEGAAPGSKPELPPFDKNDPRKPEDLAAGIYHFTPPIADYNDPVQEKTYQVSDLDDLATENPQVQAALRDAYGYWVTEVGVDGFRVDTAKFIEPSFWGAFLHAPERGIRALARGTGREDFLTFGEIYETSSPEGVEAEQIIAAHLGTTSSPGLDAALAFPLFGSLTRVIGEGRPTAELAFRLEKMVDPALVRDPFRVPTFIDNHDVERFVDRAGAEGVTQALRVIFTLPGIPVVYQGTEQGFTEPRASMFGGGWGSGGQEHFDTGSAGYTAIQGLATLRRASKVFTRGELIVRQASAAGAGVLAYERRLGAERALVVLNTSADRVLVADLAGDLLPGQRLRRALGELPVERLNADGEARLRFEMEPRASVVLLAEPMTDPVVAPTATVTLDRPPPVLLDAPLRLSGRATETSEVLLVIDDNLSRAQRVPVAGGTFTTTLSLDRFDYGDTRHSLTVYAPTTKLSTPRYTVTVRRVFDGVRFRVEDPLGDDVGPAGQYRYPSDTTFSHQMDVLGMTVEAGSTLSLIFQMRELTTVWRPQNGFDHVCFNIFFERPSQGGGVGALPLLGADAPAGFSWTRHHFAFGWANTIRTSTGASATTDGQPIPGAPVITASAEDRTIRFTYTKAPFNLSDWTGLRIYVTTWDFDGIDNRLRPMVPAGGQWVFGGAPGEAPKIMDDLGPVVIPPR